MHFPDATVVQPLLHRAAKGYNARSLHAVVKKENFVATRLHPYHVQAHRHDQVVDAPWTVFHQAHRLRDGSSDARCIFCGPAERLKANWKQSIRDCNSDALA